MKGLSKSLDPAMLKRMEISKLGMKVNQTMRKYGLAWENLLPRLMPALVLRSVEDIRKGATPQKIMKYVF